MAKEIFGNCKDCNKRIQISEFVLAEKKKQGESRPERCSTCRKDHSSSVKLLGNSHFYLKPNPLEPSLLGSFSLGDISHENRTWKPQEFQIEKEGSAKMRSNIKVNDDEDMIDLYEKLKDNQVVVAISPTGTGKSTYLPYRLLEPSQKAFEKVYPFEYDKNYFSRYGPIIITQPRTGATTGIPQAVAEKLYGCHVGEGCEIGYRHGDWGDESKTKNKKSGTQYDKYTRLVYVTDGSLSSQWINKGNLDKISVIIIDEAHERNMNIDKILLSLRQELPKYPHLKLIIASATIDRSIFVNYFEDVCSVGILDYGKYDVEKKYEVEYSSAKIIDKPDNKDIVKILVKEVIKFYEVSLKKGKQSILGFLPTVKMVDKACEELTTYFKNKKTDDIPQILPLYKDKQGNIKKANQDVPPGTRRIFIGTNIAETSLTISDLDFVVDSGLQNYVKWNPRTLVKVPKIDWHSQAGCKQRWGRVGRVREGWVKTLYTEKQYNSFNEDTPVGVEQENVENLLLELNETGITNFSDSSIWMKKPEESELTRIQNQFVKQGIIDNIDGDFTKDGFLIYQISNSIGKLLSEKRHPMSERLLDVATILFHADKYGCLIEAATFISMLNKVGDNLFSRESNQEDSGKEIPNFFGVFLFDEKWSIIQRYNFIKRQKALVNDCEDDLELVFKVFNIYESTLNNNDEQHDIVQTTLTDYGMNIDSLKEAKEVRDDLVRNKLFSTGIAVNNLRKLSYVGMIKLRTLLSYFWQDKVSKTVLKGDEKFFSFNGVKGRVSSNSSLYQKIKDGQNICIPIYSRFENYNSVDDVLNDEKTIVGSFLIKMPELLPSHKNTIEIIEDLKIDDKSILSKNFEIPVKNDFQSNLINRDWLESLNLDDEIPIKLISYFYSFGEDRVLGFWGETKDGNQICIDANYISSVHHNLGIEVEYLNEVFQFKFKGINDFGLPDFSIIEKVEEDRNQIDEQVLHYGVFNSFKYHENMGLDLYYRTTSLEGYCHFLKLKLESKHYNLLKKLYEKKVVFELIKFSNDNGKLNFIIDRETIETRTKYKEVIILNNEIEKKFLEIESANYEVRNLIKDQLKTFQNNINELQFHISNKSKNNLSFKIQRCWAFIKIIGIKESLAYNESKLVKLEKRKAHAFKQKSYFDRKSKSDPLNNTHLNNYLEQIKVESDINIKIKELKPKLKMLKYSNPNLEGVIKSLKNGTTLITKKQYNVDSNFADVIKFYKTYSNDKKQDGESTNIQFIACNDWFFLKNIDNEYLGVGEDGRIIIDRNRNMYNSIPVFLWKFNGTGMIPQIDESLIYIEEKVFYINNKAQPNFRFKLEFKN